MSFNKVLIANRGEIACRVIQGARSLGYGTVAVYSDADAQARHVQLADEAVHIGPAASAESYLRIENIIAAAKQTGADAVHPGYGFLAENADFAAACAEAGITFIGPSPEAITVMGSKRISKAKMIEAGVPCIPGSNPKEAQDDAALIDAAKGMELPVMVKASAGGGGRGMRLVFNEADLPDAIASARSEAEKSFGNGELIVEKAVVNARHVEIQVFGDTHGSAVHLGERDCSVQRRHQKLIEESPSPAVDEALRARMGEAAVNAAKAVNYVGAGTVEFLLAPNGEFYFLEMNTRLQVEHPVTELVTGEDLVQWQLRVAAGEPLPKTQEQISLNGWAIEVRLCTEDAANDFLPQTGPVLQWQESSRDGLRTDYALLSGGEVSPWYDSMQAKVIAYGPTRDAARRRLIAALAETQLYGVTSNRDFLADMLAHDVFAGGDFSTAFIEDHFADGFDASADFQQLATAAAALYLDDAAELQQQAGFDGGLRAWNSADGNSNDFKLVVGEQEQALQLTPLREQTVRVTDGENTLDIQWQACAGGQFSYVINEDRHTASYQRNGAELWLDAPNANGLQRIIRVLDNTLAPPEKAAEGSDGRVTAPMDGSVVKVLVSAGDKVELGQAVAAMEAMKMELTLTAGVAGTVDSVEAEAGQTVKQRQLLVAITPDEAEE
jgi:geranyl-CoA carboxylase alpha subunit